MGVTKGTPVESGFVIINGKCIEAPYRVDRIGPDIFINEKPCITVEKWPLWDRRVPEDPGFPDWVTKDTPFDGNERLGTFLSRKKWYLAQNNSRDVAITKYVDFLRRLPNLKSVGNVTENRKFGGLVLQVFPVAEDPTSIALFHPAYYQGLVPGKRHLQRLGSDKDDDRRAMEDALTDNETFVFWKGDEIEISSMYLDLPLALRIMMADMTYKDKLRLMLFCDPFPQKWVSLDVTSDVSETIAHDIDDDLYNLFASFHPPSDGFRKRLEVSARLKGKSMPSLQDIENRAAKAHPAVVEYWKRIKAHIPAKWNGKARDQQNKTTQPGPQSKTAPTCEVKLRGSDSGANAPILKTGTSRGAGVAPEEGAAVVEDQPHSDG